MTFWSGAGGPLIQGLGGVAASFFGRRSKVSGPNPTTQLQNAYLARRHAIEATVQEAKKQGIHPLAALGMPYAGGFSGSPVSAFDSGSAVGDGIRAVAEAGADFARSRPTRAALETHYSNLANDRAQRELMHAQTNYWNNRTLSDAHRS